MLIKYINWSYIKLLHKLYFGILPFCDILEHGRMKWTCSGLYLKKLCLCLPLICPDPASSCSLLNITFLLRARRDSITLLSTGDSNSGPFPSTSYSHLSLGLNQLSNVVESSLSSYLLTHPHCYCQSSGLFKILLFSSPRDNFLPAFLVSNLFLFFPSIVLPD